MGLLAPDSEYKLVSKVMNPFLYELFVKGNNKKFTSTNLFLKLNTYEPKNYEHIEISMTDHSKVGNFDGLIVEPATTDTLIKIDASSTVNAYKIRSKIEGEDHPIYTKEGSERRVTMVVKNLFDIEDAQNINIHYNQDERVFVDSFHIYKSRNISFFNLEKVDKQESFSISLSDYSTFYARNNIKDFIAFDFNHKSKVKGIFYIDGSNDKSRAIENVSFRSIKVNTFALDENQAAFRLRTDNVLECVNTKFLGRDDKIGEIKGNIENFILNGVSLWLDGVLNMEAKDFKISFKPNSLGGEPAFFVYGDNNIACKNFKCDDHVVNLLNVNMQAKNGNIFFRHSSEVYTKFEGKDNSHLDSFVYDDKSSNGVLFSCFDSARGSIIFNDNSTSRPTPLISGQINDAILHNCIIGDNEQALVPTYFNIRHEGEEKRISKSLSGVIFEPRSETNIITYDGQIDSVIFKNCLFKGEKNEIEIRSTNIKADNTEFNNAIVRASGKPGFSKKKPECALNTSVLSDRVELLAISETNVNSSTLKETTFSGTSLVDNSTMEKFKGNESEYKNFSSSSKDEPKVEVGLASEDIEIL